MQRFIRPIDRAKHFGSPDRVFSAAPLAADGIDSLKNARPGIVDDLPQAFTYTCGFDKIATSIVNNPTQAAWVDIGKVSADDIGQELLLLGATIEQLAADTTGAGAGGIVLSPRAWGDKWGRGAALVIAQDMNGPRRDNGWYECPISDTSFGYTLPGDWSVGNENSDSVQQGFADRILFSMGWCVGSMSDTIPYQRVLTKSFSPTGFRLTKGHAVHVALVLRPNILDPLLSGTVAYFYGHARVQLHFAKTEGDYEFNRK